MNQNPRTTIKGSQIVDYLVEPRSPPINEFLKSGSHGKLIFHFVDNKLVRVELDMTHIPGKD